MPKVESISFRVYIIWICQRLLMLNVNCAGSGKSRESTYGGVPCIPRIACNDINIFARHMLIVNGNNLDEKWNFISVETLARISR